MIKGACEGYDNEQERTSPSTPYRTPMARFPDDLRSAFLADGVTRSRQTVPGLGSLHTCNHSVCVDGCHPVDWGKSSVAESRAHHRADLLWDAGILDSRESSLSDQRDGESIQGDQWPRTAHVKHCRLGGQRAYVLAAVLVDRSRRS